jgi:hypothetical protein
MAKKLRCYLTFHRWKRFEAEGGGAYHKCLDCGKFRDIRPGGFVEGGAGLSGGGGVGNGGGGPG